MSDLLMEQLVGDTIANGTREIIYEMTLHTRNVATIDDISRFLRLPSTYHY